MIYAGFGAVKISMHQPQDLVTIDAVLCRPGK